MKSIGEVKVQKEAVLNTKHRLVMAMIEEPIEVEERHVEYSRINRSGLRNKETRLKYVERVDEGFKYQEISGKNFTLKSRWEIFKDIMLRVASELCGYRKK